MLRQSLTLMFALAGFGLLSGCGGTSMSGDSGTSKDKKKKDDAVAIDAADPYVVTGAYLTCDFEGGKDVGCSLMSSKGERIRPTQVDSLDYSASVTGGAPIQPTQLETNKWGAVWSNLSQPPKTRFKASVGIKGNIMEFGCTSVPCTSVTAFGLSDINGIIEPSNSQGAFESMAADEFCDSQGMPISQEAFLDKCAAGKCGSGMKAVGNAFAEGGKNILDNFVGIFVRKKDKTVVFKDDKLPQKMSFTAVSCIKKNGDGPIIKKGSKCSVVAYKPSLNSNADYFAVYPSAPSRKALSDLNGVEKACN